MDAFYARKRCSYEASSYSTLVLNGTIGLTVLSETRHKKTLLFITFPTGILLFEASKLNRFSHCSLPYIQYKLTQNVRDFSRNLRSI